MNEHENAHTYINVYVYACMYAYIRMCIYEHLPTQIFAATNMHTYSSLSL